MKTYNTYEAANMLGVCTDTLKRWIRAGLLKSTKKSPRSSHMITEQDLFEFKESYKSPRRKKKAEIPEIGRPTDYKAQAIQAAKDFHYGSSVIKQIKDAVTEDDISRIMSEARMQKFGG